MVNSTPEELREALRAVHSMVSKSQAALASMTAKGGRAAQLTLLKRRVRALRLAEALIARELRQAEPSG